MAGAAVGVGLALLFAPKSGARLRQDIGESFDAVREAMANRYRELAARAGVELDHLHARIDRAADRFETSAHELVHSAARQVRELNRAR
jgi:gas vesicle protein